jgi:ABC-type protease/lipase transport system fused ATPase/permease subunit
MMGYKFLGDADKEQELNAQIIEAMAAWREARRDYDKAQSEWAEVRETARGGMSYIKNCSVTNRFATAHSLASNFWPTNYKLPVAMIVEDEP